MRAAPTTDPAARSTAGLAPVIPGRRPRGRCVDGVLFLDKPSGLSSNAALQTVRRLLGARKAGHGGTLDPLASGVLPLLFGEATKFAHDLLSADKTYLATLRLGVRTSTGDAEGEPLDDRTERTHGLTREHCEAALARFLGDSLQVPPMHSALKRAGRPLYEYARRGESVERSPRAVRIEALELLSLDLPELRIRVACSKGTYIRTLAEDIGEALGCGAHLGALRREAVGRHRLADAITLDALQAMGDEARLGALKPIDSLLDSLGRIDLASSDARRFRDGQRLSLPGAEPVDDLPRQVRVYAEGHLLGVAELAGTRLSPVRLLASGTPDSARADRPADDPNSG